MGMVGLGRLELPTSPLSGARSSHLSYRPKVEGDFNTACNWPIGMSSNGGKMHVVHARHVVHALAALAARRSGQRDEVDLDVHVARQAGGLHRRARRSGAGKIPGIDLVHGGKLVHVEEEDRGADDLVHGRAGGLDDAFEIFKHAFGLRGNVSRNKLLGAWIERDLAGYKYESVGANRLRIRTYGSRTVGGGEGLFHSVPRCVNGKNFNFE